MAKKRLRVGLVGCGRNMQHAHLDPIREDGAVQIAGIADPQPGAARQLMERWGSELPYHADWRRLLRDDTVDAVVISTPHRDHYEQASCALERGLHVLVEKPLALSWRHARALLDLAGRRRRRLVVSYQRHFRAPYIYARELIRQRKLGRLCGAVGYVSQHWGGMGGWRLEPELSGGGMFMDTGSHLVAAMLWLTGLEPARVSATMENGSLRVDLNASVQVRFRNGALGTLNTFGNAGRHDERLAVAGSEGSLVISGHQWRVGSVVVNDEPVRIPARIQDGSPDRAFYAWIRNGGRDYERPEFALRVAKLTEAAYRSAARGKPVRVAA